MRIAWFTPFSARSAIGKYSKSVTDELVKYCKVDLWLSEDENLLPTDLNIVRYLRGSDLSSMLRGYDHVVYNMGNYLDFHKDMYEASRIFRGIVIVHDFVMHHFFTGFYFLHKKDTGAYVRDMELLYGEEGKREALKSLNAAGKPVWESDDVVRYPFFEKAVEGALGVIVHSHFHGAAVRQKYMGPVGVLAHPFYRETNIREVKGGRKSALGIREDQVLLLTVGHVNRNKRIDKVIRVLGENKDIAKRVTYVVIGSFENGAYVSTLKALVERYDLANTVLFMGFQPDDVLYAHMATADGFINLRFPAMEGASWSLVEELHFGKPVVVSDTGYYSELPDDCVLKIKVDLEEDDLLQALRKIASVEPDCIRVGLKGKEFALATFTASRYCEGFLKFLDDVGSWKPVFGLIDRVSRELSLMGVSPDSPLINRIAGEINSYFE